MPEQQALLLTEFDPKAKRDQQQADDTAQLADVNRRAQAHHEQPGVNWMAHDSIRSFSNQFVILFERDIAAPVSGKRLPRPQRKEQSANANRSAGDLPKFCAREDLLIHIVPPLGNDEQRPTDSDGNAMGQPGRHALLFNSTLGPKGIDEPDDGEGEPAGDDDVAGGRGHCEISFDAERCMFVSTVRRQDFF